MKRKSNKSEFIRNASLEAAARVEKGEYPFPLTKPLDFGWGSTRKIAKFKKGLPPQRFLDRLAINP